MNGATSCAAHPTLSALARCQRCNTTLCDDCFRLWADGKPCCDACAAELQAGPGSRWPFATVFLALALTLAYGGYRLEGQHPSLEIWLPVAVIGALVALGIGWSSPKPDARPTVVFLEREAEVAPDPQLLERAAHPYRARIARVARRVVPLSGRATALVMTAAMLLTAVALPLGAHLPYWVEAELVLASWWLGVSAFFSWLLYSGRRLTEDHRVKVELPKPGAGLDRRGTTLESGCAQAGGCAEGLVVVVLLALAAAMAWLLVEVVIPLAVFAVYYFVTRGIGRLARDRHDCRGHVGRSLGYGFLWSTLYALPIVLLIGVVGFVLGLRAR